MTHRRPRKMWHWLWDVYIVGVCGVAGIIAVFLLDHRFPGNVPVAVAALAGIVVCVLALARRATRLPEGDWRTFVFVGVGRGALGRSRSGRRRSPWLRYRRSIRSCSRRCRWAPLSW